MIGAGVLERLQSSVTKLHNELVSAQRYGWNDKDGEELGKNHTGCYGGVYPTYLRPVGGAYKNVGAFFWTCFHGDGMVYDIKDLTDPKVKQDTQLAYTRPWNKFEGTERSLKWIKFLMSENSPWKALHPFIVEKDQDFINNSGFIFSDVEALPTKLWYNFLMAVRYPWEQPESYAIWLKLLEGKETPQLSLFVANHFWPKKGAKSWEGPWECVYPWSFLEGLAVQEVKKFATLSPGDLRSNTDASPNVVPLWGAQGPSDLGMKFVTLDAKNELTLDTIYSELKAII